VIRDVLELVECIAALSNRSELSVTAVAAPEVIEIFALLYARQDGESVASHAMLSRPFVFQSAARHAVPATAVNGAE
jgi:hypothetical protein